MILGRRGAGKGTQCIGLAVEFGAVELGVVHLSTGEVFRRTVRAHTRLGGQVQAFLARGSLVPDELVAEIVATGLRAPEVHRRGLVLDGLACTTDQARMPAELLHPGDFDLAVHLVVSPTVANRRLLARRICETCAYTTTVAQPRCVICGGEPMRALDAMAHPQPDDIYSGRSLSAEQARLVDTWVWLPLASAMDHLR